MPTCNLRAGSGGSWIELRAERNQRHSLSEVGRKLLQLKMIYDEHLLHAFCVCKNMCSCDDDDDDSIDWAVRVIHPLRSQTFSRSSQSGKGASKHKSLYQMD